MNTNLDQVKGMTQIEMLETLQCAISDIRDMAQGLDDCYFSQAAPSTEQWFKVVGSYRTLLIALEWFCDLADTATDIATIRRFKSGSMRPSSEAVTED